MSRYKDFSEKVYFCLKEAVFLWPFQPGKSTEIDHKSVFIDSLGKLKQKMGEIDNSDINLDDFAGHNVTVTVPKIAERRPSYHAWAISLAKSIDFSVMCAAYGVDCGGPGLPREWFPDDTSDYAESIKQNWPSVFAELEKKPLLMNWRDLEDMHNALKEESILAERAAAQRQDAIQLGANAGQGKTETLIERLLAEPVDTELSSEQPPARGKFGFPIPSATHSSDFSTVQWYGTQYDFTKTQAACVKVLWEAWENKTPGISEETILENAGSCGSRLRDVFDKGKHRAWGTMIVKAGKGRFQLQEPKKV
jgi:hypothetical protein